jgi:hypothetical protein
MGGPNDRVTWRGVTLDRRTADMMGEVERLMGCTLRPSQGSWSGAAASAGTHSGGGAVDLVDNTWAAGNYDRVVQYARQVGFAAWHRTPQQSDWVRHAHLIAVQPGGKGDRGVLSGAAHDQVVDYFEGRNGLASNARDDGPRDWVGTTWETYNSGGVLMAAVPIVFFESGNAIYEADILSGTYRVMPNPQTLTDRRAMLDKLGIPYLNWPGGKVSNPAAFGVNIS